MKKSNLIIATCLVVVFMFKSIFAQHSEVQEIEYQHSVNLHKMMQGMLDSLGNDENMIATKVMEKLIPQNDVYNTSLYFDEERAIMRDRMEEGSSLFGNKIGSFPMSYSMMDKKSQKNFALYFDENGNYRTERPLETPGKLELVEEEKIILGYVCQKALWTPAGQETYRVWYTPKLAAGFSPIGYVPVPGLVLAAESETISCIATKIQKSSWPVDLTDLNSFELLTDEEVTERIFEHMKGTFELFDFIDSIIGTSDEPKRDKN